jgi:hypothetical protein
MSRHSQHSKHNHREMPTLMGHLCGKFYEPPSEHFDEKSCRESINLGDVSYLRLCFVGGEYGRSEKRGILFQTKFGQEHQVNYCNCAQAETEFNAIQQIISQID